jgi:hypothetical protein
MDFARRLFFLKCRGLENRHFARGLFLLNCKGLENRHFARSHYFSVSTLCHKRCNMTKRKPTAMMDHREWEMTDGVSQSRAITVPIYFKFVPTHSCGQDSNLHSSHARSQLRSVDDCAAHRLHPSLLGRPPALVSVVIIYLLACCCCRCTILLFTVELSSS